MQEVTTTKDEAVRFRQDIHDRIRRKTREAIEAVLEEELTAALGSGSYERNEDRHGYRNGAQVRTITAAGGSHDFIASPDGGSIDEIPPAHYSRTRSVAGTIWTLEN